jgi:hypothetical protein
MILTEMDTIKTSKIYSKHTGRLVCNKTRPTTYQPFSI